MVEGNHFRGHEPRAFLLGQEIISVQHEHWEYRAPGTPQSAIASTNRSTLGET